MSDFKIGMLGRRAGLPTTFAWPSGSRGSAASVAAIARLCLVEIFEYHITRPAAIWSRFTGDRFTEVLNQAEGRKTC